MATSALSLTDRLCHFSFKVHFLFTNKNFSTPKSMSHVWSYSKTTRIPALHSANGNIREAIEQKERLVGSDRVKVLKQKIEVLGIKCDDSCLPGQYFHLLCPKCQGGKTMERSLSFNISQDVDVAMWRCFRTSCGWTGQAFADSRMAIAGVNKIFKVKSSKQITPENVVLEPLGDKLMAYFSERMISEETLKRNAVMQMSGDKVLKVYHLEHCTTYHFYVNFMQCIPCSKTYVRLRQELERSSKNVISYNYCWLQYIIAFTYRQNGAIVGCKYRTMEKRFWQEKDTRKWLYGLDDINEATKIIIVEGEIDKLSVEEAGFCNCVSVPGGAPQMVSAKDLPSIEKLSQIVLATDGDPSGRSLAEELARRLGKER
ncbi:hypothetical protein SADUNF_Sadunf16G0303100 [Salix dunnii]|uniref:Toprim domain-containing protein n=1 Tax=Salix dunnii TaxID=1413687 RepID=A0A835JEP9_9ROSI|nr:hypothetical protein SADUNF_Sadunf16G0303100 [Salix dunnii]